MRLCKVLDFHRTKMFHVKHFCKISSQNRTRFKCWRGNGLAIRAASMFGRIALRLVRFCSRLVRVIIEGKRRVMAPYGKPTYKAE